MGCFTGLSTMFDDLKHDLPVAWRWDLLHEGLARGDEGVRLITCNFVTRWLLIVSI
jgi:hypothetical protein